jgi:hypothetical protein
MPSAGRTTPREAASVEAPAWAPVPRRGPQARRLPRRRRPQAVSRHRRSRRRPFGSWAKALTYCPSDSSAPRRLRSARPRSLSGSRSGTRYGLRQSARCSAFCRTTCRSLRGRRSRGLGGRLGRFRGRGGVSLGGSGRRFGLGFSRCFDSANRSLARRREARHVLLQALQRRGASRRDAGAMGLIVRAACGSDRAALCVGGCLRKYRCCKREDHTRQQRVTCRRMSQRVEHFS